MKILGSVLATAALACTALVAVPTTASAAPYPGTVATTCSYLVPSSVRRNRTLHVKVRARTSGNARVSGKVLLRVYKVRRGPDRFNRSRSVSYSGRRYHTVSLGKFKRTGRYSTRMWFLPANSSSVYKKSHSRLKHFRVKR